MRDDPLPKITPQLLLKAYSVGIFPMAEHAAADEVFWVDPSQRGVLPLDGLHISRRLARSFRKTDFSITVNRNFSGVLAGCADREETWISRHIRELYLKLFGSGQAMSIEVWYEGNLAGGLYGIVLGGAFFGESMFSRRSDASKFALIALVARLRTGGFSLLDTQFITPHLARLGAVEISRAEYQGRLALAVKKKGRLFRT